MKKSLIIISSLLLVAFVAATSFAWGPGSSRGMGFGSNQDCPRYGGETTFDDLSTDQKDQLTALRQAFIDDTYEIRSEKFVKQQEMRLLMETSEPDREKLGKLSQDITELQKQVMDKKIDFQLAAKKIAPELKMGPGYGKGRGKWSKKGGQRGCQGRGYYGNNN